VLENIPQSFIGFAITGLFIWQFIPLAVRLGLVDKPGGHKTHQGLIPVIGGLAMFAGIIASLAFFNLPLQQLGPILFAGLLVLAVGTIDDKFFLSSLVRFVTQIGAALIIVTGDKALLIDLGHLVSTDTLYLGSWAIPLTVFATVGVINAVNMTDGLDGLAGGLCIVTLSAITILISMNTLAANYFIIPIIFISVLSAFLMFNLRTPWLKRAKIFMGNGGSMLLGVLLAWLLIKFSQGTARSFDPTIALWIFAIPLLDTVTIMLRRLLKGKSPFAPDREHLHHLFLKLGFSVGQSVAWVLGIASILTIVGILSFYFKIPEHIMFFSFLTMFIFYFWSMDKSWKLIAMQETRVKAVTGGTDNSVINPLKREKCND